MPYPLPDPTGRPVAPSPLQAARQRATALLTDRFADDSLTEAEFEARLVWLTTADEVVQVEALAAELATPGLATRRATALPRVEDQMLTFMTNTTRAGRWTPASVLSVHAVMSTLELDLRQALVPPVCEIDVTAIMANVRIVVPPGMAVECDASGIMGSVRNDTPGEGWRGAPRLRVSGYAVLAEIAIILLPRS
jgi:hypothetical protein